MATLKDLQDEVETFIMKHNLICPTETRLLDLQSEVGELAKVHLKGTNYGRWHYHDGPFSGWMDELGDVLFSLVALANLEQVDLEDCLRRSIEKYEDRIKAYGDARSKRNRPVK